MATEKDASILLAGSEQNEQSQQNEQTDFNVDFPTFPLPDRTVELLQVAAKAASEKLGENLVAYDVSARLPLTDAFLLVTAESERQVGAIVEEVEDAIRDAGAKPLRREGFTERRWVLLDFGDVVVHVLTSEDREFYALERIWGDCPTVPLSF